MSNVFLFANDADTTLAASVGTGATALVLSPGSGAKFPNPSAGQQFAVTLTDAATGLLTEIVYCTARTADVLTVVRAQEGTIAQSWTTGDNVANLLTAGQMSSLTQFAVQQYMAGGTVNALTLTPTPAVAAYVSGQTWNIIPAANNTGPATLAVSGLPAKAIVNPDSSALTANAVFAGGLSQVIYQATLDKFVLMTSFKASTVSTFGEITTVGSGNIAIPANATQAIIEFCGGGGGGGTGDGGAGGPSGTGQAGGNGADTTVNGVTAKAGTGGAAGLASGNTYGGNGGTGGAGTGSSYRGQGGSCGLWAPAAGTLGNLGGLGGSSIFGGGGTWIAAGPQSGGYGAGGAGGETGNSASYSGGGGGASESRRIILSAATLAGLAGNIPYNNGAGGAGGTSVGNFPGGAGGNGYIRYQFNF